MTPESEWEFYACELDKKKAKEYSTHKEFRVYQYAYNKQVKPNDFE